MLEVQVAFDDAAAYDRLMGAWSRAIGERFLDWLAPAPTQRWLDIGCGAGAFTQLILQHCSPQSIVGADPAAAQVDYARQAIPSPSPEFRVADAMALPFADSEFDIVASALVINFIPDRAKAKCTGCCGRAAASPVMSGSVPTPPPMRRSRRSSVASKRDGQAMQVPIVREGLKRAPRLEQRDGDIGEARRF